MAKLNHTKAKWDIALFFCYALLTSCLFSRGIFMLYLTHKGLSIAQVGLYQILVQLSMFLLEVPTGSIGDKLGKTRSLQIGTLFLLLHCVLMMALQQPAALVALGFLEGMGYTFCSGSDNALFYELLKKHHREQDYLRLNARLKSAQSILTGATISAGALIASWSWEAVYGVTALCLGGALLALTQLQEPAIPKTPPAGGKGAFSRLRHKILYPSLPVFLLCFVGFSFMDGISGSYYNYNQIIFPSADTGRPHWHLLFRQLFCHISGLSVRDLAVQAAVQTDHPFRHDCFAGCAVCRAGVHPAAGFVCGVRLHLLPDAGSCLYPSRQHHPDVYCVGISGHHPFGGVHAAVADVRRELFCLGLHSGPDGYYRLDAFPGSGQLCRAGEFSPHPDLSPKTAGQICINV